MIMNMNEKGRQTKLLAAIAIIAMVVCAFAVILPSEVQGNIAVTPAPTTADNDTVIINGDVTGADGTVTTSLQQLQTALGNSAVTEIVIQTSIEIPEGTTLTIPKDKTVWINNASVTSGSANMTNKVCLTIEGTLVVEGTLYNNAGTNKATSGFYNSGTITYNGSGVLYSTSADGSTGTGQGVVNGFFSVIGTGAGNYKHMYAASLNAVASKAIDAKYNDGTNGKAIYSYGTTTADATTLSNQKVVIGGVNNAESVMTVPETVTLTIEKNAGLLVKSDSSAVNNGTIANSGNTEILGNYSGDGVLDNSGTDEFAVGTYLWDGTKMTTTKYVVGQAIPEITLVHDSDAVNVRIPGTVVTINTNNGSSIETISGKITYSTAGLSAASGFEMGDATINEKLSLSGQMTYAAGYTITFGTNGVLDIGFNDLYLGGDLYAANPTGKITGEGTIYTYSSNKAFVQQYYPGAVESWTTTVENGQEFVDAVLSGSKNITINGEINLSKLTVNSLELDGVTIDFNGDYDITVGANDSPFTLVLNKTTITSNMTAQDPMGTNILTITTGSSMEINESGLYIKVSAPEGSVTAVNNVATADNIPGDVRVGFGSEYYLSGTVKTGQSVKVWGTLIVPENSNLVISEGAVVDTVEGAQINVLGTLTISGTMNLTASVVMNVDGTVEISNSNGNAQFNNDGKVTVDGTMTVSAPNTGRPANNLNAGTDFTVNGTLNMNGTLSGTVQDKGTVTINGRTDDTNGATVVIYADKTLQVTSVTGKLNVTDKGIALDQYADANGILRPKVYVSDGNQIVLENVRGVTISEQMTSTVHDTNRYVYCDMYISGTIAGAVDNTTGTVDIEEDSIKEYRGRAGQVFIDDAMALGKDICLTNASTVTVTENGTITAVVENSSKFGTYNLVNKGTLTVEGTITLRGSQTLGSEVNGVRYTTTDQTDGDVTTTYTNFAAALGAIENADSKTISVIGNVTVGSTDSIANGETVQINGTLEVASDVTLTVENGGKVTGATATINVKGTFTSANFLVDVSVRNIVADVIIDNAPARTYTSLANALAGASAGDIITLNGPVQITENMTIPEGVTVKSDYTVNIRENATLAVAGTLEISAKGDLTNVKSKNAESTDRNGAVTVTGTVSVVASAEPTMLNDVSGAHYYKTVGAIETYYVTSVEIAAQNVDRTLSDGTNMVIVLKGAVNADSVTFTKPESASSLKIQVQDYGTADEKTVVAIGTMTLVGAELDVNSGTIYTGSVTAAANGASASVSLDRAGAVNIASIGIETAEGTTDYLAIWSTATDNVVEGTVTITEGTVTVASINGTALASGILTTDYEGRIVVSDGATLAVRTGSTINVYTYGSLYNQSAGMTVDGTVDVKGTVNVNGILVLNGTMTISESAAGAGLNVAGSMSVLGTLEISAEAGKEGSASVVGILSVGSKPTALGNSSEGTVNGEIDIVAGINGYGIVKVYAGTVGDIILGGVESDSTEVVINGTAYMTVYTSSSRLVSDIIFNEDIELAGLRTPTNTDSDPIVIFSDAEYKNVITPYVGNYDTVYLEFDPSYVFGTVSEGTGLTLFIDGVPCADYAAGNYPLTVGTHTVSYDVQTGYNGDNVTLTFNGQAIQSGSTITITADMTEFNITVTGATPSNIVIDNSNGGSNDMGLTDYLLIVLVILIVIMAIIVALRLMRS